MELKEQFCNLYRGIVHSGDERKMEVLGGVVKKMMYRMIETSPTQAKDYIDELEAVNWDNYLTQKEASAIVQQMTPKAKWSYSAWDNEMTSSSKFAKKEEPYYNEWALYATMCMISSDSGDTLGKYIVADEKMMFELIYRIALDKLKDKDGRFCIRKYFDV